MIHQKLIDLASPIVELYKTDLLHDQRWLSQWAVGDTGYWSAQECGTHMFRLGDRDSMAGRLREILSMGLRHTSGLYPITKTGPSTISLGRRIEP